MRHTLPLLFFVMGCSNPHTYRLENWSPERTARFHEAMGMWNEVVAPGEELHEVSGDEGWRVLIVPDSVLGPYNYDGLTCEGWDPDPPCPSGGVILVNETVFADYPNDPWVARSKIAHELGHTLGLDHSKDEGALMYEGALQAPELTQTDLEMCADEGVCLH